MDLQRHRPRCHVQIGEGQQRAGGILPQHQPLLRSEDVGGMLTHPPEHVPDLVVCVARAVHCARAH
jgi:hypothetical protein